MSKKLKPQIHMKLVSMHSNLGRELRSRSSLRFGKTLNLIEAMNEFLIARDSWE